MASRNGAILYKLPERIKEIRISKGMTQTDLGIAMGSNKSAVSKLESGLKLPDLTTLQNAADAMDVSIGEWFMEEDDPFVKSFRERLKGIPSEKRAAFESLIEAAFAMAGV